MVTWERWGTWTRTAQRVRTASWKPNWMLKQTRVARVHWTKAIPPLTSFIRPTDVFYTSKFIQWRHVLRGYSEGIQVMQPNHAKPGSYPLGPTCANPLLIDPSRFRYLTVTSAPGWLKMTAKKIPFHSDMRSLSIMANFWIEKIRFRRLSAVHAQRGFLFHTTRDAGITVEIRTSIHVPPGGYLHLNSTYTQL